jgi:hypothetical protein
MNSQLDNLEVKSHRLLNDRANMAVKRVDAFKDGIDAAIKARNHTWKKKDNGSLQLPLMMKRRMKQFGGFPCTKENGGDVLIAVVTFVTFASG